jgi:hypothetical protein
MLRNISLFVLASTAVFSDRWLVLPPRLELGGQESTIAAGDLARAMALYLKVSRVGEIVQVTEAEGCLKQANTSMAQKIAPETLRAVAKHCMAERMLLSRIRRKDGEFEISSKVYFREGDQLTDTLVTTGSDLNTTLGQNLTERFAKSPATPKESSADLIVAGDTYGGAYFDWPQLKNLFLSLDSVKSSFCFVDGKGKIQTLKPQGDKSVQKEFLDKLRFEGFGTYSEADSLLDCTVKAAARARQEGRNAVTVFVPSDFPRDSRTQINLRAQIRRLARAGKVMIAPSSTATQEVQAFWQRLARELGENSSYLPSAQRAKVGLATGQEWFIFRRGGRIYELRDGEASRFEGGVVIPEKYSAQTAATDLVKIYEALSKNKVVTPGNAEYYGAPLKNALAQGFKTAPAGTTDWRILIDQNGQNYYLSLTARDAQKLKVDDFARIYVELKSPSTTETIRNRATPAIVIESATDSSPALELNAGDFIRNPGKYLRKGIGGRSFYILSGKVVRIIPPEADALDTGF